MATVTWDSGITSQGQADGVSYTYTNTNFATQLNTIPPFAKINSVKITAKFQVNLYTNNGGLTVGSKTWEVGNTDNHNWITIVNNEDITAYLTGASETANAGELPSVTVYANKRMGFARTFKTQVTITWDYTPRYQYTFGTNNYHMGTCRGTGLYDEGETVTAKAVPQSGYRFVKWSDESTENPRTFTASKDTELTAYFELDKINNIYVNTVKPKAIYYDEHNIVFVVDGTIPTPATSIFDTVDGYHLRVQNTVPSGMTEVKEVYRDTVKVYG